MNVQDRGAGVRICGSGPSSHWGSPGQGWAELPNLGEVIVHPGRLNLFGHKMT